MKISDHVYEVFICDMGDMGVPAKLTYESILEFTDWDFWFVIIPANDSEHRKAMSWAKDIRGVIVADHRKLLGGYVSRNMVHDLFPNNKWFTRVAPGVVVGDDYINFLQTVKNDRAIGATGVLGFHVHGNWENIDGNEVPPRRICHVLDDSLWSWRVTEYRYEPPFNNIALGHYDHQLHLGSLGYNCFTSPSSCVRYLPDGNWSDPTIPEAVNRLSEKWSKRIDFVSVKEIMGN